MKKWLDSPRYLFAILRVVAVLAIAAGIWLTGAGFLPGAMLRTRSGLSTDGYRLTMLLNCGLWTAAWGSFFGMCTRLRKGGTAFTAKNSRTLKVIGGCVALIGTVTCVRALPRLIAEPDVYLAIEAVILPGVFVTVGAIALILSRLLDHAMALEAEQADVI